jgi:hypothetical protein
MKTLTPLFLTLLVLAACSIPPERPVTRDELYKTGIYTFYTISDSPESVITAINKDGEVILDALYRNRPIWIKILAKPEGLKIQAIEK